MKRLLSFLILITLFFPALAFAGGESRFDLHSIGQQKPGEWFNVTATVYSTTKKDTPTPGGHGEFMVERKSDGQECQTSVSVSDSRGEFHGRCRSMSAGYLLVYFQSTDTGERSNSQYVEVGIPATPAPAGTLPPIVSGPLGACGSGISSYTFEDESKCDRGSFTHYLVKCANGYQKLVQRTTCVPQTDEVWYREAQALCANPSCPVATRKPTVVKPAVIKATPSPSPVPTPSALPLATITPTPTVVSASSPFIAFVQRIQTFFLSLFSRTR